VKFALVILFFIVADAAFAQPLADTCLTRNAYAAIKHQAFYLKDQNMVMRFNINMLKQLKLADTLCNTKDSAIVHFINKAGGVDCIEKKFYRHQSKDSSRTYYNSKGLEVYYENWHTGAWDDSTIISYKNNYYWFVYDEKYRLIKHVYHISTPRTRRILYNYDTTGKQSMEVIKIDDDEFWD